MKNILSSSILALFLVGITLPAQSETSAEKCITKDQLVNWIDVGKKISPLENSYCNNSDLDPDDNPTVLLKNKGQIVSDILKTVNSGDGDGFANNISFNNYGNLDYLKAYKDELNTNTNRPPVLDAALKCNVGALFTLKALNANFDNIEHDQIIGSKSPKEIILAKITGLKAKMAEISRIPSVTDVQRSEMTKDASFELNRCTKAKNVIAIKIFNFEHFNNINVSKKARVSLAKIANTSGIGIDALRDDRIADLLELSDSNPNDAAATYDDMNDLYPEDAEITFTPTVN